MNFNNTFYKTFTGSDTLVFIILPDSKPILLGSLTTLSYSIFREKRPVPLLGKINTGGYTRGMRTIAGSMIFTLINQSIVKDIVDQVPYLKKHDKVKADELPFFDLLIVSANEYGSTSQMYIYGAEFVDDAQVISIENVFIESTYGFVARDIEPFDSNHSLSSSGGISINDSNSINYNTIIPYDYNLENFNSPVNYVRKIEESEGQLFNITKPGGAYIYNNFSEETIIGKTSYGEEFIGEVNSFLGVIKINKNNTTGVVRISETSLTDTSTVDFEYLSEQDVEGDLSSIKEKDVGCIVITKNDLEIKLSYIIKDSRGNTKCVSKTVKALSRIPVSCLIDNSLLEDDTKSVKFVIYINNNAPVIFNLKVGV